jgi:hypothetical protein
VSQKNVGRPDKWVRRIPGIEKRLREALAKKDPSMTKKEFMSMPNFKTVVATEKGHWDQDLHNSVVARCNNKNNTFFKLLEEGKSFSLL